MLLVSTVLHAICYATYAILYHTVPFRTVVEARSAPTCSTRSTPLFLVTVRACFAFTGSKKNPKKAKNQKSHLPSLLLPVPFVYPPAQVQKITMQDRLIQRRFHPRDPSKPRPRPSYSAPAIVILVLLGTCPRFSRRLHTLSSFHLP